ncbi:10902_t:CDS:2 [Entrophospora sp. SA101]|nr:1112_t:CDS:2 [Entrophospora sp. SA101]CAJ0830682.1 10902_t:CDS:2 [Entrophospora sp. SA101]
MAALCESMEKLQIKGGGIKTFTKTRWSTVFDICETILRLCSAFEDLFTNNTYQNFRNYCIDKFNERWVQFEHKLFLLTYFLHPKYHGCGLQDNIFRENCLFAGDLLQKIGYNTSAVNCLIAQLRRYWLNKPPFDLGFDSLRDTPVTWWQTCVEKPHFIQTIALNLLSIIQTRFQRWPEFIRIYISNSKNLLQYFGQELTSEQIEAQVVNATYHLTNSNEIEEDVPFASLSDDGDDELPQDSRTFVSEEELRHVLQLETYVIISNQVFVSNLVNIQDDDSNNNNNDDYVENYIGDTDYNVNILVDDILNNEID